MPYLTPDNEGITVCDNGLMYRCYPTAQQNRLPRNRTDHKWIISSFPVTCCGACHATREDFEEHLLDLGHYERMQGQRGNGQLPDSWIDPRLLLGEDAFDALPKREQYVRMRPYIDRILPAIEAKCDPTQWREADLANLTHLSSCGLSFMNQIISERAHHSDDDEFFPAEEFLDDEVEDSYNQDSNDLMEDSTSFWRSWLSWRWLHS